MMQHRHSIEEMIARPETPEGLRQQLKTIQEIRTFASTELALPQNESYTSYVDLKRPYVVWNVVATPEFSLRPKLWCYPIAGCLPYRGFYRESNARSYGKELRRDGYDVTVYGVPAYSTLKWFADPVLSTFGHSPPPRMAALVFHELAHQKIYVPGDARFNEAFAVAVETEGVLRYFDKKNNPEEKKQFLIYQRRGEEFIQLLLSTRNQLKALYKKDLPYKEKRVEKHLIVRQMLGEYMAFKRQWGGFRGYDGWFRKGVNNARLTSIATYHDLVGSFRALFKQQGSNFPAFYEAVAELAQKPSVQRHYVLARLAEKDPPYWRDLGPDATQRKQLTEIDDGHKVR